MSEIKKRTQVDIGPFEEEPASANEFYAAIGRVVMAWGRFEAALDQHLNHCIAEAQMQGIEQDMQVSLKNKVQRLRKLYETCPTLTDRASQMGKLIDDTLKASQARMLFAHASIEGFFVSDPPKVRLRSIKFKSGKMQIRKVDVTAAEILTVVAHIEGLYHRLLIERGPRLFAPKSPRARQDAG